MEEENSLKGSLNSIDINKNILKSIQQTIPQEVIQTRTGGNKSALKYISGATVTDLLNKTFNYMWNWENKRSWIEKSSPSFNKYYSGPNQIEYNNKTGRWEEQLPVCHVLGTLTVMLKDNDGNIISIKKDGFGSKSILGKQTDQESIFKAADTDALKKAASRLGIGLDLYRKEEEQSFFEYMNYEDPWDDEAKEKHKESLKIISDIISEFSLTSDQINTEVQRFDRELYSMQDIIPQNVDAFAEFLYNESHQDVSEDK